MPSVEAEKKNIQDQIKSLQDEVLSLKTTVQLIVEAGAEMITNGKTSQELTAVRFKLQNIQELLHQTLAQLSESKATGLDLLLVNKQLNRDKSNTCVRV